MYRAKQVRGESIATLSATLLEAQAGLTLQLGGKGDAGRGCLTLFLAFLKSDWVRQWWSTFLISTLGR